MKTYNLLPIRDWNLQVLQLVFLEFTVGAAFAIQMPLFKLRYSDKDWYRCFHVGIGIMMINIFLTIPMWKEEPDASQDGESSDKSSGSGSL